MDKSQTDTRARGFDAGDRVTTEMIGKTWHGRCVGISADGTQRPVVLFDGADRAFPLEAWTLTKETA